MDTERDKFLTEAMGECWHDRGFIITSPETGTGVCRNCQCKLYFDNQDRINFSTWEGFGKLVGYMNEHHLPWMVKNMTLALLDPARFADAVYEYLKEAK